jgi:hypothetical protein
MFQIVKMPPQNSWGETIDLLTRANYRARTDTQTGRERND